VWLILFLALISAGVGLITLIFLVPAVILPLGLYLLLVRVAAKDSYLYRNWRGLPFVGEYAIMRGYLFLRIKPRVDYTYLRPIRVEKLGEMVLLVSGSKWLRQKYEVHLRDNEERTMLVQKLINLGAREESTHNHALSGAAQT